MRNRTPNGGTPLLQRYRVQDYVVVEERVSNNHTEIAQKVFFDAVAILVRSSVANPARNMRSEHQHMGR